MVASGGVTDVILPGLGLVHQGRGREASRELPVHLGRPAHAGHDGHGARIDGTFIELQIPAPEEGLEPALGALRDALAVLGIGEHDLTTDTCTAAVLRARA